MRNSLTTKSLRPLLSVEEAAMLLGETRSTLYRAIKASTFPLPIFRIGSRMRIPRRSVERLLAGLPLIPTDDSITMALNPNGWTRDQPATTVVADPSVADDSNFPT